MKKYLKVGLFGLLIWLIPFVSGFLFYSPQGQLLINQLVFKSIMVVICSLTGAILLIIHFKKVINKYLVEGIIIGVLWFIINIILDVIILIPMAKMTFPDYLSQIGLSYLIIPIMSITV